VGYIEKKWARCVIAVINVNIRQRHGAIVWKLPDADTPTCFTVAYTDIGLLVILNYEVKVQILVSKCNKKNN
jgi:hypothetical protein